MISIKCLKCGDIHYVSWAFCPTCGGNMERELEVSGFGGVYASAPIIAKSAAPDSVLKIQNSNGAVEHSWAFKDEDGNCNCDICRSDFMGCYDE